MNIEKTTVELDGGGFVCLAVYEILRIPDISILKNGQDSDEDALQRQGRHMVTMLSEIHQSFRMQDASMSRDCAIELLWLTRSVQNQMYAADISMYVVVRSMDDRATRAELSTDKIGLFLENSLQLQKYEYRSIAFAQLKQVIDTVNFKSVKAIIKEAHWENLQNTMVPQCLSYDCFPDELDGMEDIVHSLSRHPGCIFSVQLLPTQFTGTEAAFIAQMAQGLSVLSRGVYSQGVGSISFTAAEKNLGTYKYYLNQQEGALFTYNVLVAGTETAVMDVAARVYGSLQHKSTNMRLRYAELDLNYIHFKNNFFPLPWAAREEIEGIYGLGTNVQLGALGRLPLMAAARECVNLFRLPVGGTGSSAGLKVNYAGKNTKTYDSPIINNGQLEIGTLQATGKDTLGIGPDDLTKHLLVTGTPGSGKTTFLLGLLTQLWERYKIPFLVIEPAKNEYRALIDAIPDLQVFTPGKNFISPLVLNPFRPPERVRLESYKSTLKTAFAASMSMASPLDKIFEETIHNCYADFHWLDSYTTEDGGGIFNIDDFIRCFEETFSEIGYTGDARNIGRAGVVRLKGIARLFDHYYSIPLEDLLSRPTVIELAAIENPEEKALLISLLLLCVLAYVNSNYLARGTLKNVLLLEEAHVLLDADTNVGEGNANPSLIAQNLIKRMLAELRAYGVGLIIADQSPRKVTSDVIALTDMKIAFRIVEKNDRDILADSINLDDDRRQRLARLKPGEAFFFFQKLEEPEEIRVADYRQKRRLAITISDGALAEKTTYWASRRPLLRPYPECTMHGCCNDCCDYELRLLGREIARQVYRRYFRNRCDSMKTLAALWSKLRAFVESQLNGADYSPRLMACVQVHLLRMLKYENKPGLSDKTIQKTLEHFRR